MLDLTVPGDPVPKGRPRHGRGRTYTPAATRDAEQTIGLLARAQLRSKPPTTAAVSVEVEFYLGTHRRRDIDNLLKLVLDALNGICWVDDAQVVTVTARKRLDRAQARTVIRVTGASIPDG